MSADTNTGASIALVITDIYSTIQKIQSIFDDYNSKLGGNLTVKQFYFILDPKSETSDVERIAPPSIIRTTDIKNDRNIITKLICNIGADLKTTEDADNKLFLAQTSGIRTTKGMVTFLYVVFLVIILITLMYAVKDYITVDKVEVVKTVLIFLMVIIVVTSVYQLFTLYLNNQTKQVTTIHKQNQNKFQVYKDFIFGQGQDLTTSASDKEDENAIRKQPILDDKGLLKMMSSYYATLLTTNPDVKKKLTKSFKDKEKFNKEEDAKEYFKALADGDAEKTKDFWSSHLSLVMSNIYAGGTGLVVLSAIDEKSDNFRILRSTNEILDNFYKLLLRSYNALDTEKSEKAKRAVIDNIVIKQLINTNVFALENQTALSTEDLVNKLESGDHYHVLLLGFKYSIIYLYPIWRNINPNSLVNFSELSSDNPEKARIDDAFARDPAFQYVLNSYPLIRANYKDVLSQIDLYGKSVNTMDAKETWNNFLTFSVAQLTNVNTTYTATYIDKLNSATTDQATRDAFGQFVTNFLPYFDKLYDDVLVNDLAILNPDPTQYVIYDKVFMRTRLEEIFAETDVLQLMNASYREFILDVMIETIVRNQQKRLQTTVFNVNDSKNAEKNLQTAIIHKAINDTILRIASQLVSFNIKTSDYTEYIMKQLFKGNQKSELVVSAINDALLQIDFQTALAKKVSPLHSKDEDRYVSPESFIQTIDEMRWTTFSQSLRIDELKVVVNSLRTDQIDMFNDEEQNLKIARTLYTTSIFLSVFGFILYFIISHDPRSKGNLRGGFIQKIVDKIGGGATTNDTTKKQDTSKVGTNTETQYKSILQTMSGEFLKTGVPISLLVLFLSIFNSYVQKAETNIQFNKSQVTRNTNGLKTSISDFKDYLLKLDNKLTLNEKNSAISDIVSITDADKTKLYIDMINILSTYDKCNYVIGAGKNTLPFPYAEVVADGFMVAVIVGAIIYVFVKFAPIERIVELKDFYEYKEASETLATDVSFVKEITGKFSCHKDTVDSIVVSVKLLSAIAVVVFVLVYSIRVNTSTKLYAIGLQNSKYAATAKCCN